MQRTARLRNLSIPLIAVLVAFANARRARVNPDEEHSLLGTHITIVTVEDWPFINVRGTEAGGSKDYPILPWVDEETQRLNWDGWIIDIIEHLSQEAGFTYSLQLPTRGTTYGAADKELRLGCNNTKAPGCVNPTVMFAGAYISVPRLEHATITSAMSTQPLAMLAMTPSAALADVLFTWTKPFSQQLWLFIILAGLLASFTFHSYIEENCGAASSVIMRTLYSNRQKRYRENQNSHDEELQVPSYYDRAAEFGQIAVSSMKCAVWPAKSPEGKAFAVMWSFCGLIIVALYTANLAISLAQYKVPITPPTFADVIKSKGKYRACVLGDSAYADLLSRTPLYEEIKQVPKPDLTAMASGLENGDCECVIERKMHVDYVANSGFYKAPFKVMDTMVGGPQQLAVMIKKQETAANDPGLSIDANSNALLDLERVRNHLSYWLTKASADNALNEMYQYSVLRGNIGDRNTKAFRKLDLLQLGGFFALYMVLTAVIFALRLVPLLTRRFYMARHGTLEGYYKRHLNSALAATRMQGRIAKPSEELKLAQDLTRTIIFSWEGRHSTSTQGGNGKGKGKGAHTNNNKALLTAMAMGADKNKIMTGASTNATDSTPTIARCEAKAEERKLREVRQELYWRTLNTLHVQLKHTLRFKHEAMEKRRNLRIWEQLACRTCGLTRYQHEKLRQILVTALRVSAEPHLIPLKRRQKLSSFKFLARKALLQQQQQDDPLKQKNANANTDTDTNNIDNTNTDMGKCIDSTKQHTPKPRLKPLNHTSGLLAPLRI